MAMRGDQVIPALLAAAPGFEEAWRRHLEWWGSEERGVFNDAGAFAHYIVDSYETGNTTEFPAVFATLEEAIRDGDEEARAVAIVGVLEDIQTIACNRSFGAAEFGRCLGPLSRKAWDDTARLWRAAGGSLADVIRLENQLRDEDAEP